MSKNANAAGAISLKISMLSIIGICFLGISSLIRGADLEENDQNSTRRWLIEGERRRAEDGNYVNNDYIFDGKPEQKGLTIELHNMSNETMIFDGLYMRYGRCTVKPEEEGDSADSIKRELSVGELAVWDLSNKKSHGPDGTIEYISQSKSWGIRLLASRKRNGTLQTLNYELSPSATKYVNVEMSEIREGRDDLRHSRSFTVRNIDYTINLTAELYDFRYPSREDILSKFQREDNARSSIDYAMFDTIDVGDGCVGIEVNHNWSRVIRQEFSWGLNQRLGFGVTVKASAGLFGFGVQTAVSTNFEVGAHQDWSHAEDLTLSHSFRFTPQTEGIYKIGMFTVGMEGYTIPFHAKILFSGRYNDRSPAPSCEIMKIIRERYAGVSLLTETNGIVEGRIEGELKSKSVVDSMFTVRKTL